MWDLGDPFGCVGVAYGASGMINGNDRFTTLQSVTTICDVFLQTFLVMLLYFGVGPSVSASGQFRPGRVYMRVPDSKHYSVFVSPNVRNQFRITS